jgi:hypothetical protein
MRIYKKAKKASIDLCGYLLPFNLNVLKNADDFIIHS